MLSYPTPTPLQADQAAVVHAEIVELFTELEREGANWRVILTGACTAIAHVVTAHAGEASVPQWFATQAAVADRIANPPA